MLGTYSVWFSHSNMAAIKNNSDEVTLMYSGIFTNWGKIVTYGNHRAFSTQALGMLATKKWENVEIKKFDLVVFGINGIKREFFA